MVGRRRKAAPEISFEIESHRRGPVLDHHVHCTCSRLSPHRKHHPSPNRRGRRPGTDWLPAGRRCGTRCRPGWPPQAAGGLIRFLLPGRRALSRRPSIALSQGRPGCLPAAGAARCLAGRESRRPYRALTGQARLPAGSRRAARCLAGRERGAHGSLKRSSEGQAAETAGSRWCAGSCPGSLPAETREVRRSWGRTSHCYWACRSWRD